jgi:polyvinyl alcohol dehydrogenase (cytochrome)
VQFGIAADESNVYVAVSDRFASAGRAPGLSALKLDTGDEVWRTPNPLSSAQSAAVTAIPELVFSGGLHGLLRAYSAADGKIVWIMDTKGHYQTVNGVAARGGSIDGVGAVVVDGMVYVGSGSLFFGGVPGNVLLAYSVDGM